MKTLYKWSVEDYHQLIETGVLQNKPVELLAGDIVTMSPEEPLHSSTSYSVVRYLRRLLEEVAVVREAHPITLVDSEPEPDIAIVRSLYTNYLSRHPYAGDVYWLIEVAYRSLDNDLNEKKSVYASNNIPEYWIIDLKHRQLLTFSNLHEGRYRERQVFTSGSVNLVSFPDIAVDIEQLLLA